MFDGSDLEKALEEIAAQGGAKFPDDEHKAYVPVLMDQLQRMALILGTYDKLLERAGVHKEARTNILDYYNRIICSVSMGGK